MQNFPLRGRKYIKITFCIEYWTKKSRPKGAKILGVFFLKVKNRARRARKILGFFSKKMGKKCRVFKNQKKYTDHQTTSEADFQRDPHLAVNIHRNFRLRR